MFLGISRNGKIFILYLIKYTNSKTPLCTVYILFSSDLVLRSFIWSLFKENSEALRTPVTQFPRAIEKAAK